jgi:hypothetical protein
MTQAPVLRRDLPPEIPDDVDDPTVEKARGVVTLPRWIDWSSDDPTYDLSDRWQQIRVYEQVLREGTADDVRYFIDVDVLLDLWDELILPPAVSRRGSHGWRSIGWRPCGTAGIGRASASTPPRPRRSWRSARCRNALPRWWLRCPSRRTSCLPVAR